MQGIGLEADSDRSGGDRRDPPGTARPRWWRVAGAILGLAAVLVVLSAVGAAGFVLVVSGRDAPPVEPTLPTADLRLDPEPLATQGPLLGFRAVEPLPGLPLCGAWSGAVADMATQSFLDSGPAVRVTVEVRRFTSRSVATTAFDALTCGGASPSERVVVPDELATRSSLGGEFGLLVNRLARHTSGSVAYSEIGASLPSDDAELAALLADGTSSTQLGDLWRAYRVGATTEISVFRVGGDVVAVTVEGDADPSWLGQLDAAVLAAVG